MRVSPEELYMCGKYKQVVILNHQGVWGCYGSMSLQGYKDKNLLIKAIKSHGYRKVK